MRETFMEGHSGLAFVGSGPSGVGWEVNPPCKDSVALGVLPGVLVLMYV